MLNNLLDNLGRVILNPAKVIGGIFCILEIVGLAFAKELHDV
jgi:hypothetical protein